MQNLVTVSWLKSQIEGGEVPPDLVVLDASMHMPASGRDGRSEYGDGHIPGARYLDLASFIDAQSALPNTLPSAADFAERMTALGVTPASRVVLYDDSAIKTSARAWFILRLYGHDHVAILDGGFGAWKTSGGALEAGMANTEPASQPYPVPTHLHAKVYSKADIIGSLGDKSAQIVDARDNGRFTGTIDDGVHGMAGGHIPGARNVPFPSLYHDDGTMRDAAALKSAFTGAGLDLERPIIASCGSGVTACNLLFALNDIGDTLEAGNIGLYDGSWSEWGADPDTPKATGEAEAAAANQ